MEGSRGAGGGEAWDGGDGRGGNEKEYTGEEDEEEGKMEECSVEDVKDGCQREGRNSPPPSLPPSAN